MGNNNLDNQQTTEVAAENAQATQQPTQASVENPSGDGKDNQPSYADLMKKVATLEVDNRRYKKANDSLSSENANYKKQINEKMTIDQQKAVQEAEKVTELNERLQKAEQELALNAEIKRNLTLGMKEEDAIKIANLHMEGDRDSENALMKAFIDAEKKDAADKAVAELYAKMPQPISGNGDGQIDYEKQYNDKLASGDIQGAFEAQISGMLAAAQPQ